MASTDQEIRSDEEMRKLLKPDPTLEQVIAALKTSYFKPDEHVKILKELDSYDDKNYLVENGDGTKYLAKVHNGVESQDFINVCDGDYFKSGMGSVLHMQNAILDHLSNLGCATSIPQRSVVVEQRESVPSPASIHSLPVVSKEHSPQDLVIRLLSWVPGRTMSSLKVLPIECLADAGRLLGRIDEKLDVLDYNKFAASQRYHAWDGKHTCDLRKYIQCIPDERRRAIVASVLDTFQEEILESGVSSKFRTGILQGDFNDANILVDENFQVSGVIDFGDTVLSWRVLDISVAMTYAILSSYGKAGRGVSAASAMLRGFHSIYPLQDLERAHLHLLIACRLACSATLGAYSLQQNPENKYLLLHSEPAWRALDLLWGSDVNERSAIGKAVRRMFDKACAVVPQNGDGPMDCSDLALPDPQIVDLMSSVRVDAENMNSPLAKRYKVDSPSSIPGKPVITFVTGNKKKLEEVKRILGTDEKDSELAPLFSIANRKVDLPELQGDPIDIAKEKCRTAANAVGGAVITEDTSLCFTALQGLPGPYIKWFLDECGHEGLNNMIAFSDNKSAYAQTVVAFCAGPGNEVVVFDGRTRGKIVPARGPLDFGWDPVFEPDEGGGLTYAEMSKAAKDSISHRSRAFSQLREYFLKEKNAITSSIA